MSIPERAEAQSKMERAPSARRPPASMRWSFLRRACLSKSSPQPDNPSQMGTRSTSLKTTGGFNLISSHRLHAPLGEELGSSATIEDITGPRDACICYNLPVEPVLKLILTQRMDPVDLTDFEISTKYDIDTTGLVHIQHNIRVNAGVFGDTKVNPRTLHWNLEPASDILNSFDVIVASDCTFFKEFHDSLARTVKSLLKHSETSEAIFLGPKRGDSLNIFLEKIKEVGMCYELVEKYDSRVWNIHQKLINGDDASWPNYDQDHCYPFMLRIKFKSP